MVARYGGEEFALILPGVMSGRATDLLERFRRVIAVKPIHLPNRAQPASVTVSIGVAIWPDDGENPAEILPLRRPAPLPGQGRRGATASSAPPRTTSRARRGGTAGDRGDAAPVLPPVP